MTRYLRETGLTATECLERSPKDLMGWIGEREKLHVYGTTGGIQDVIELFYEKYRAVLRPAVDERYPKAKAMREPLQKIYCLIFDFMSVNDGYRTYVTHARIAAYTEHILSDLYFDSSATRANAFDSHPIDADVATFARLKGAISLDYGRKPLPHSDLEQYSTELLHLLKAAEAADPGVSALNLRIFVVHFIDKYSELLNPRSF